ncbi:MAG TPA: NAD(P)-dependent oxidoreductase [Anaerolineales bacterium]|nr:NAD(P)-dependent oxidoreductase [Anaerolineales bacterium]
MKVLVTGSAGHLGEALVRTLRDRNYEVIGTDLIDSDFTDRVGSIIDRAHVKQCMSGIDVVIHAATLHKPHVATHSRQSFVGTNITGTLNLLEEAVAAGVHSFIFTSTTSTFGAALTPSPGAPAAWITEEVTPVPKNIYGVTKHAAENLCELFHRNHGLSCIILRTSRFFPEADDRKEVRDSYEDRNIKVNEFLYRRVDIQDVVSAHLLTMQKASTIGFARYIISATTPFTRQDLLELHTDAPSVLKQRVPGYEAIYARLGWKMFPTIDRVYINERARNELGWQPEYSFSSILERLKVNVDPFSPLTRTIGSKGYHPRKFAEGLYPVD